jgi:hypothetical protein
MANGDYQHERLISIAAVRESPLLALNGHASCDEAAKTAWRIVANIAKLPSLLRQYHSLTGRSRDVRYGGIRDHRAAAMIGHHRSDECR